MFRPVPINKKSEYNMLFTRVMLTAHVSEATLSCGDVTWNFWIDVESLFKLTLNCGDVSLNFWIDVESLFKLTLNCGDVTLNFWIDVESLFKWLILMILLYKIPVVAICIALYLCLLCWGGHCCPIHCDLIRSINNKWIAHNEQGLDIRSS